MSLSGASLDLCQWGSGEGVEATDYRQNEQPITDRYVNANVQMSIN